jgi:hypothetical protein
MQHIPKTNISTVVRVIEVEKFIAIRVPSYTMDEIRKGHFLP